MKIIKIHRRVGNKSNVYKFRATVDLEYDVTKYGDSYLLNGKHDYDKRIRTAIFSVEDLERASNFKVFEDEFDRVNKIWWKNRIKKFIIENYEGFKFLYQIGKSQVKKIFYMIH